MSSAEYHRAWYHKNKEAISERKCKRAKLRRVSIHQKLAEFCLDNPCSVCGEDDYVVLDFDHVDRDTKVWNISDMVSRGFSWNKISLELEKCRVLCSNCHRRHTAAQMGWYNEK